MGKKQKQQLSPRDRKIKKKINFMRFLIALNVILMVLLVAGFIVSFIDKSTPKIVYTVVCLISCVSEIAVGGYSGYYAKKFKHEMGYVDDENAQKPITEQKDKAFKIKDKLYHIFNGIGLAGDALLIAGVVLLVSQVKGAEAVTVILILLGTLVAVIFHTMSFVRFFKRKHKAEKGVLTFADGNGESKKGE